MNLIRLLTKYWQSHCFYLTFQAVFCWSLLMQSLLLSIHSCFSLLVSQGTTHTCKWPFTLDVCLSYNWLYSMYSQNGWVSVWMHCHYCTEMVQKHLQPNFNRIVGQPCELPESLYINYQIINRISTVMRFQSWVCALCSNVPIMCNATNSGSQKAVHVCYSMFRGLH